MEDLGHTLVLCAGNTCRSPFFAAVLASQVSIKVVSAAYLSPSPGVSKEALVAASNLVKAGTIPEGVLVTMRNHAPRAFNQEDVASSRFSVIIDESPKRFRERQSGPKGRPIKLLQDALFERGPIAFVSVGDKAFEMLSNGALPAVVIEEYERQQKAINDAVRGLLPQLRLGSSTRLLP